MFFLGPCPSGALCLLRSASSRTCACAGHLTAVVAEASGAVECRAPDPASLCQLDCNAGRCVLDEPSGLAVCQCPPLFDGDRCQRSRCSGYCRNKGACYPHFPGKLTDSGGP